jgi:3-methyladenine DNA glycosylase AlkC
MQPFKDIYNPHSIRQLSLDLKRVYSQFDHLTFEKQILSQLNEFEMKERVRLISFALKENLPNDYSTAVSILINSLAAESDHLEQQWVSKEVKGVSGFMVWPLCQYIEDNGLQFFEESMSALYEMTKRFSAEFSIRPFIELYDEKVYKLLRRWALDPSTHVRRLVSEGTRPNLPWGVKVDNILLKLERNIDLLEILKGDSQEYVRRSVANHLNDISKYDKNLMLSTCRKWFPNKDQDKDAQWIIRHASRSLLKAANKEALKLNGFTVNPQVSLKKVQLSDTEITEGDTIELNFELQSLAQEVQNLLIDYIIVYPKKNDKKSAKTFRLKKLLLNPGEKVSVVKKIAFKKVTTRTHYSGKHLLKIKVGDKILSQCDFFLFKN